MIHLSWLPSGWHARTVNDAEPIGLNYYTDAAEFRRFRDHPTIILGPGDPEMAHKVNESIEVAELDRAVSMYEALGRELLS